jgi:hypothetical protein
MKTAKRYALNFLFATAGVAMSPGVPADTQRDTASNPTWKAECGTCHVAYPPSMLPAGSWRALMSGLDRHFGVDAAVDAGSAAEISAFLKNNAGRNRHGSSKPVLRITETAWFRHEHDEVDTSVWTSPSVKTASNCTACHAGAEHGDFDEHGVRLPR